ncbi:MAG: hypothetical protein ACP5HS_14270 [Anaerolineae bacterium]
MAPGYCLSLGFPVRVPWQIVPYTPPISPRAATDISSAWASVALAPIVRTAPALFVNYFVTSSDEGAILETNRGVPALPAVRQAISNQASATDAAVYRIYDAVADRTIPQDPNLPNDQEFVNELELIGQHVMYGESTVDEAADELIALIERLAVK